MSEIIDYTRLVEARYGVDGALRALKEACALNETDYKEELEDIIFDVDKEEDK